VVDFERALAAAWRSAATVAELVSPTASSNPARAFSSSSTLSPRQNRTELPRFRSAIRTFERAQVREYRGDLNERTRPSRAIVAGSDPACRRQLPARRLEEVREQVEAGRLAGAVRSDRVDAAPPNASSRRSLRRNLEFR
jgi:hypothetical protein